MVRLCLNPLFKIPIPELRRYIELQSTSEDSQRFSPPMVFDFLSSGPKIELTSAHIINMARPLSDSSLAMADSNATALSNDPSSADPILTEIEEACPSLRFHMDNSVWDVIHEEVMDWRDSSWTSMNLPGNKTCKTCLSFILLRLPTIC